MHYVFEESLSMNVSILCNQIQRWHAQRKFVLQAVLCLESWLENFATKFNADMLNENSCYKLFFVLNPDWKTLQPNSTLTCSTKIRVTSCSLSWILIGKLCCLFSVCLSVCQSDLANSKASICWFGNLPCIFYQTLAKIHIFRDTVTASFTNISEFNITILEITHQWVTIVLENAFQNTLPVTMKIFFDCFVNLLGDRSPLSGTSALPIFQSSLIPSITLWPLVFKTILRVCIWCSGQNQIQGRSFSSEVKH